MGGSSLVGFNRGPIMATLDVVLKEDLKAFLDSEAARTGYSSAAEYVGAVLETIWRESSRSAVEAELVRRVDGPPAAQLPPGFWDGMKSRLGQRRAASGLA
jgi:hypothetical protein